MISLLLFVASFAPPVPVPDPISTQRQPEEIVTPPKLVSPAHQPRTDVDVDVDVEKKRADVDIERERHVTINNNYYCCEVGKCKPRKCHTRVVHRRVRCCHRRVCCR